MIDLNAILAVRCPPREICGLGPDMLLRSTVVLLLTIASFPQSVAESADAVELHRIVTAYYYAIGENRLEEAMSFYHDDSPQADETRRELVLGQSDYLQRTSTLSFDLVHHDGERAVVLATHRHLRIAGIKFMEERVETRYVLRRQQGAWKLWSSFSRQAGAAPSAGAGAISISPACYVCWPVNQLTGFLNTQSGAAGGVVSRWFGL